MDVIKYSYETDENELKMWIDPEDGSLNVRVGHEGNSVRVPAETGREMVSVIKSKQEKFKERVRVKESNWTKFVKWAIGEETEGTLITNPYAD